MLIPEFWPRLNSALKTYTHDDVILCTCRDNLEDGLDQIYNVEVVKIPYWYHTSLSVLLGTLAFLGISLNGFVLWCYMLCPSVSVFI